MVISLSFLSFCMVTAFLLMHGIAVFCNITYFYELGICYLLKNAKGMAVFNIGVLSQLLSVLSYTRQVKIVDYSPSGLSRSIDIYML